jgi:hypothetical protein
MIDLNEHEKIVNKEIENLNSVHEKKLQELENNANIEKEERSKMNEFINGLSLEI